MPMRFEFGLETLWVTTPRARCFAVQRHMVQMSSSACLCIKRWCCAYHRGKPKFACVATGGNVPVASTKHKNVRARPFLGEQISSLFFFYQCLCCIVCAVLPGRSQVAEYISSPPSVRERGLFTIYLPLPIFFDKHCMARSLRAENRFHFPGLGRHEADYTAQDRQCLDDLNFGVVSRWSNGRLAS